MAKIGTSSTQSGMQTHQLMARGFTGQGAGELVAGKPITQANDVARANAALASMNQCTSLQMLQLQQTMQSQALRTTTIANIMKLKHDLAKNIINNIR